MMIATFQVGRNATMDQVTAVWLWAKSAGLARDVAISTADHYEIHIEIPEDVPEWVTAIAFPESEETE